MKTPQTTTLSLEEQAAAAVRLGRELSQMAAAIFATNDYPGFASVKQMLQRFGEHDAFDPRDDASLQALPGIVEADLESELLGYESVLVETYYDEHGQHCNFRNVPHYTDRGQKLVQLNETLSQFISARNATIDRIAAERAVQRQRHAAGRPACRRLE
jgi:hypothetical protein